LSTLGSTITHLGHARSSFFVGFVALCFAIPAAGADTASTGAPPDLDHWVERAMETFEVPGLAVTIVKDGETVAANGYGVRLLGERAAVDERTLFGIASNTKAFTATALGLLVEEGKIEWDGRVVDYLPWFQMWDPYVTRELTVRDLLVHRSGLGLGAGDLLWWPPSTYDRKEIARRLRYLEPETSFRSAYAYDNVLYIVAGEVIEAVSGQSWEDFVQSRILDKVGMSGSNTLHSAVTDGGNVAATHARVDGRVRPIAPFTSDNTNAAGGINSSAEDMAKWLKVQLAHGQLTDGSRLFSEETARELVTVVTPMPISAPPPELAELDTSFNGYGLGFGLREYRGHKLVQHTGGLPGYVSRVAMIPDAGIGVAVLTNQESRAAYDAIVYHILDHYLGAPPKDWIAAYEAVTRRENEENASAVATAQQSRDESSRPSLPLEQYAGTYTDAWYGDVTIGHANGKLAIEFSHSPALRGPLEHWQHDTFVARWADRELRADAFITFALKPDGTIEHAKMQAVSPDTDFSYDFHHLLLVPHAHSP
jgi:CubicO group peptidase (beta-lactamase class C family)